MPGTAGSAFTSGPGNMVQLVFSNKAEFLGRFKQYRAGVEFTQHVIMDNLADEIVHVSKSLVATDTEKTKDSIRKERRGADHYVVVDRFGDRPEVPIYLEIGTHKMAARPFLVPSANLVMSSGGLLRAAKEAGGLLGKTPGRK